MPDLRPQPPPPRPPSELFFLASDEALANAGVVDPVAAMTAAVTAAGATLSHDAYEHARQVWIFGVKGAFEPPHRPAWVELAAYFP